MFTIGTDSPDSEDVVGSSVRSSSVLSRLSAMEVTEATPIEVVPTPVSEEDHQRIKLPAYIVKQGWLQKRGEHWKNWRNRYFILKSDGRFLGYRSLPDSSADTPCNNFTVFKSEILETDTPKQPFTFSIRGLQLTTVVVRAFSVETEAERCSWIAAINQVKEKLEGRGGGIEATAGSSNSSNLYAGMFDRRGRKRHKSGKTKITLENFEFIKVLGKGNFAKVILCREIATNDLYAIKSMKKDVIIEENEVTHVFNERNVLKKTKHPFLLDLRYAFTTSDRLFLVTEYVNGGDLYFHLMRERKFSEDRARFYGAEIVSAIGYLHSLGIVHRDLKPENLLLDHDGHIKLADFGICKENMNYGNTTETFCGTPEYLSPEVLIDNDYGLAVDWWGVGVIIYEMLSGRLPFHSDDRATLFKLIQVGELRFPTFFTGSTCDLLTGLLAKDPLTRLGGGKDDGKEVQAHKFFEGIDWEHLKEKKLVPPFKPHVKSETDTSYFDTEFTGEAVELTPPRGKRGFLPATTSGDEWDEAGLDPFQAAAPDHDMFDTFSYSGSVMTIGSILSLASRTSTMSQSSLPVLLE